MKFFLILISVFGGLIAGFGASGGVLLVSFLFSVTSLSTAEIAGTSSILFVFASLFVSSMYCYSGDVEWRLIIPLIPATLAGTTIGAQINSLIPREIFGFSLAILVVILGLSIAYRGVKSLEPYYQLEYRNKQGIVILSFLGLLVGVIGGIFGIGGPAITIPALIFLGIPSLKAIGAGMVQGFFVTSSTATNYALSGDISIDILVMIGPPFIISQLGGWYFAQNIEPEKLKAILGIMLAFLGPYIITAI